MRGVLPPADLQGVWREDHPEFDQFLEVMRDPELVRPSVVLGNLAPYRKMAIARPVPRAVASG